MLVNYSVIGLLAIYGHRGAHVVINGVGTWTHHCQSSTFHILVVWSSEHVATMASSGLQHTLHTSALGGRGGEGEGEERGGGGREGGRERWGKEEGRRREGGRRGEGGRVYGQHKVCCVVEIFLTDGTWLNCELGTLPQLHQIQASELLMVRSKFTD